MRNVGSRLPRKVLAITGMCTACWLLLPKSPAPSAAARPLSQTLTSDWQAAAGGRTAFDTASVTQNTNADPAPVFATFPLGPGDVFVPNAGIFEASNVPLSDFILFAYKITPDREHFVTSQLPDWVTRYRFDIEARAQGNPTKDQIRLMMQSLLADRFRLITHYEAREIPVFALLVDQPGRLGPLLQQHPQDLPCPTTPFVPSPPPTAASPEPLDRRFPSTCGGILQMPPSAPGRSRIGARNVTMQLIASSLAGRASGVDRPVVDKTGLTGRFDFAVEIAPQHQLAGAAPESSPTGPGLTQALKEQLGLKLEPQTASVDFLIVDSIQPLLPN